MVVKKLLNEALYFLQAGGIGGVPLNSLKFNMLITGMSQMVRNWIIIHI